MGTLGQVDFAKRSFTQLPFQHDVLPLDVLNTWLEKAAFELESSKSVQPSWLIRFWWFDGLISNFWAFPRRSFQFWRELTLQERHHSHMSFSLMMPQKYCGFSTKLDKPESSSEEGGLVPKFKKRRDTARSSSVLKTDDPDKRGRDTGEPA